MQNPPDSLRLPREVAPADTLASRARASAPPDRWLMLAALAAIACFIAAELYSQHQARVIDDLAAEIATNAAPSIQHLAGARREIRRWQSAAHRAIGALARHRPIDLDAFRQADRRLHDELSAYLELPFFPGERALYQVVDQSVDDFGRSVDRIVSRLDEQDLEGARTLVHSQMAPLAEQADSAVGRLLDLNADHISGVAIQIAQSRRRNMRASYAVHGLAAAVALLLMVLAARAARTHVRLWESRNRLAEDRAQELEHFARQVAHDLKNPLGSMALRVMSRQRQAPGDEATRDMLDRLAQSIDNMNRIVDGLLDFALSGGQPLPDADVDLTQVIESVAALVRSDAERVGATISVEPGEAVHVACPEGALTSVLSNLLRNAVKYIVEGLQPVRLISVRVLGLGGHRVRVEVADTGPGIPPGQERSVFEPFMRVPGTSHQPGLGLGLATVRRIVEVYGGQVGVEATPGRGSCFWFELPRAPSAEAE